MKVFVCMKQVPDTETKIKIAGDGKSIDPTGVKWVMNPYDEYAVEEAVKFREANPGTQVWVLSLGPKKRTIESLRTALAMGADEAIAIDAAENLDSLQTARGLASVIKSQGEARIIFTGKLAIDDNASCVSQMLAEFLEMPHATVVSKFSLAGDSADVERDVEGGAKEIINLKGPSVIAANKGLNLPRYATLPGIMKAKKKVIQEIDFATLQISATSKIERKSLELPPEKPAVKMLTGDANSQASQLVQALRDEAKVL